MDLKQIFAGADIRGRGDDCSRSGWTAGAQLDHIRSSAPLDQACSVRPCADRDRRPNRLLARDLGRGAIWTSILAQVTPTQDPNNPRASYINVADIHEIYGHQEVPGFMRDLGPHYESDLDMNNDRQAITNRLTGPLGLLVDSG